MRALSSLVLCTLLTACGGGGSTPDSIADTPTGSVPSAPAPAPAPAPTLTLSSTSLRTIAGGSAIPLTATLSSGGTVHWTLAAGMPGTLSADSGGTVRYQPPAAGLAAPTAVTVTASGDGASATLTLAVTPDPGTPGLYQMSWRNETDPTMLRPVALAADLAGNTYVLVQTDASPSRMGPPLLVKIAPDGSLTTLIGPMNGVAAWFGQPDANNNVDRLTFTRGFRVDRAGNLYFATVYGLAGSAQIRKITPAGVMSVLAGSDDAQGGTVTDGAGSAARFASPQIVGIDYDDNIYVLDKDDTPRKVTPAGVVTTLSALPAGLNADMNGTTYSYDTTTFKLMRTGPDGVASVDTSAPYCTSFVPDAPRACLTPPMYNITPAGGASYVMLNGNGAIRRLVLPH
jgi:hypothetical protein